MVTDTAKQMGTQWTGAPAGGAAIPGNAKPGGTKAMLGALFEMMKEAVASGDADTSMPGTVEQMIGSGADAGAVMDALRQAMEAGRLSPWMYAKAEKLLVPQADEMTDRTKILRGDKNQLMR